MFRRTLLFPLALLLLAAAVRADEPLQFSARQILKPESLSGDDYRIGARVPLRDQRFQFELATTWGTLEVDGLRMLELRLEELKAIQRARRMARNVPVIEGLLETARQTPRGVGAILSDPIGSVLRVPEGIGRVVTSQTEPEDRRAGSLTRRQIAAQIGCDPETTNPVLEPLLDRLAIEKGVGQIAGKVGMSVAVPGLGLVPLTDEMQQNVIARLPHEVNAEMNQELAAMGVDQKTRLAWIGSEHYTTLRRLAAMARLRKLEGVDGRPELVQHLATARSEAEALARLDELRLLTELDAEKNTTVRRFRLAGFPVAVRSDKAETLLVSADYLADTGNFRRRLAAYRGANPAESAEWRTSGYISPAVRQMLDDAGIASAARK